MSLATHEFSFARANNGQSKFVPNDWVDTFCKLLVDVNICLPRIQALVATLGNPLKDSWQLHKDVEEVASMMQSGCTQCYDRRIVDLSVLKAPSMALCNLFPSANLFAEGGDLLAAALRKWAKHVLTWICTMYEVSERDRPCHFFSRLPYPGLTRDACAAKQSQSSCFCCFEDLPAAESILRVPTPKRMGMRTHEFHDWSNVVTAMARKRSRSIRTQVLPKIMDLLLPAAGQSVTPEAVERVLMACWNQVAVLNMEIINTIIFYISYTIRNRGEIFIRSKLVGLFAGTWGSDKVLEKLASPSGPVARIPSNLLTQRIARILLHGSGSVPCISPLVCIRLIQFTHGVMRLIVEQSLRGSAKTHELLQQVLILDGQVLDLISPLFGRLTLNLCRWMI